MRRVQASPTTHHEYVRFRARMVLAGIGSTYVVCVAMAIWTAATWDAPHRPVIAALTAFALVGATIVAFLPAETIVRSRLREPFFLAWSLLDIAVITAVAALDGGAHSPTALVYFLTLVFAALSYPLLSVIIVSGTCLIGFVSIAAFVTPPVASQQPDGAYIWFFAVTLGVVAAMCMWQSQISAAQRSDLLRLSRTDPLTGVLNRLGFAERFEEELAHARRQETSVGLIALDLEGFKEVNDTHGHAAGDELLRWVATTLGALMRPGDIAARLGGDEFTVTLRDTGPEALALVAARVRRALAERVKATTGLACFPADGSDLDTLLHHADQDLYATRAAVGRAAVARR